MSEEKRQAWKKFLSFWTPRCAYYKNKNNKNTKYN